METVNNTILIIEDDLGLNELISEKIKELGFQTYSVFSVDEAINCLSEYMPYLMVVDYSLSDSTAKDFIDLTKTKGLILPPFVVTTGQGDERIAVDMMKLGARDYIIKDTNLLELLPNIIGRVAKEIDNENKLKLAEIELKESEEILFKSQQVAQLGSYSWDIVKGYWTSSAILDNIFGIDEKYNRTTQGWLDLIHPDWQDIMNDYITHDIILKHQRFDKEYKIIRKDNGEECWVHGLGDLEFDSSNNPIKLFGTISNINQQKNAEEALIKKNQDLDYMNKFMVNREVRMAEMKKEVNELLERLGEEKRYL